MNMPGFHAEASLGPTTGTYRGRTAYSGSGKGDVSMQLFRASSFLSRFGRFGVTIRCCGFSKVLHRFVCTTQTVSPFERCTCEVDALGHPFVICSPLVLSPE